MSVHQVVQWAGLHAVVVIGPSASIRRKAIMAAGNRDTHLVLFGTHHFFVYSAVFDAARQSLTLVEKKHVSEHTSWLTKHPYVV